MNVIKRATTGFWNFWIKPVRAEPMAAFRISIGLIVALDTSLTLLPFAGDWFSANGLYPVSSFESFRDRNWRWSILDGHESLTTLRLLLSALILSALFTTVGFLTRLSTVVMWVLLFSFQMRNPLILNGGDVLLRASVFLLMLMPAGAALSLDNLIRGKLLKPIQPSLPRRVVALLFTHAVQWAETLRGESSQGWVSPWTVRLAQIQIAIVYFFTGVDKVRGFKPDRVGDWIGGEAGFRALNHGTISRFAVFGEWPWWLFAVPTWMTLAWEIAFPLLVLWKRTRWYALSIGVLVHVGIFVTMEVTHFSFTTMAYYWLFVPAAVVMDMAGKATGSVERRKYTVFYDGMCPVCKRSKRTIERLDWLGRFEFADIHDRKFAEAEIPEVTYADMLKRMYVKRPDGKHFGGFKAFRAMSPLLPLTWVMLPFLWLPGAAWIGEKVYKFIAKNRFKYAKCDDEFCSLHLKLLAGNEVDDETIQKIVELHEKYRASEPKPIA